jgi:isopenicillin N synthase-like dioxygenase
VVNPAGERARHARYSMPFFLHFRPDFLIEPLAQCADAAERGDAESPITAHDYLMERLREINLA